MGIAVEQNCESSEKCRKQCDADLLTECFRRLRDSPGQHERIDCAAEYLRGTPRLMGGPLQYRQIPCELFAPVIQLLQHYFAVQQMPLPVGIVAILKCQNSERGRLTSYIGLVKCQQFGR